VLFVINLCGVSAAVSFGINIALVELLSIEEIKSLLLPAVGRALWIIVRQYLGHVQPLRQNIKAKF
jgi:hypothetical protein